MGTYDGVNDGSNEEIIGTDDGTDEGFEIGGSDGKNECFKTGVIDGMDDAFITIGTLTGNIEGPEAG